jgi:2'-5' RNA ligase
VRLFLAAELPEPLRLRLAQVQRELEEVAQEVRWTRPEGMHLTFLFLGEMAEDRVPAIVAALGGSGIEAAERFSLQVRGLGAFPRRGRPRVVFAAIDGDRDAAVRQRTRLEQALAPLGFRPEGGTYEPHLTLGRVKPADRAGGGRSVADLRAVLERRASDPFGAFEVEAVTLFESRLSPGGADYRPVVRFPLAGAPASGIA